MKANLWNKTDETEERDATTLEHAIPATKYSAEALRCVATLLAERYVEEYCYDAHDRVDSYAVMVRFETGELFEVAVSVSYKPTFNGEAKLCGTQSTKKG